MVLREGEKKKLPSLPIKRRLPLPKHTEAKYLAVEGQWIFENFKSAFGFGNKKTVIESDGAKGKGRGCRQNNASQALKNCRKGE